MINIPALQTKTGFIYLFIYFANSVDPDETAQPPHPGFTLFAVLF